MTSEDHTRGPVPCDQVAMFVDGELGAEQAEAFRSHLVQCARCQAEMHALLQLAGLAEEARRAALSRPHGQALRRRRSPSRPAAGGPRCGDWWRWQPRQCS